jgi:predicted alpha/beta-fold hydrolase
MIVGVSLGGNVLLKWLGEQEDEAPKQVIAAGAISVPFYLAPCAAALDRGFERLVYTASFMRSFRRKVRAKARVYPGFVDVAAACRARTFREYDGAVTAPLEGFRDAMDYWVRASCGPFLGRVRRPTLVINALDDPFVPPAALPDPSTLSSHVTLELTSRGGHAGFFDGRRPWAISSWAERRVIEFLASRVANVERSASITA